MTDKQFEIFFKLYCSVLNGICSNENYKLYKESSLVNMAMTITELAYNKLFWLTQADSDVKDNRTYIQQSKVPHDESEEPQ